MAIPELGAKQVCPNCQSKFYDLGRRPAVCPKCHTSFDPEEALKSRRVRARSVTPDYEDEADEEKAKAKPKAEGDDGFEEEVDETPEIDEAVEAEPIETDDEDDTTVAPVEGPEPDLGVDFEEEAELEDDAEDVPFLEEEEDDDFVDDDIEGLKKDDEP